MVSPARPSKLDQGAGDAWQQHERSRSELPWRVRSVLHCDHGHETVTCPEMEKPMDAYSVPVGWDDRSSVAS
jgi:hypothetical protein